MGISIDDELLTFSQAAATLPGRPNASTVWRWAMRGVKGIKLEWLNLGGRRYTSREAIQRFAERVTAVTRGEAAPSVSAKARQRAIAQAERELDEAGI